MPPFFERDLDYPTFVFSTVGKIMGTNVRSSLKGLSTKMIKGSDSVANEVEKAIFEDFLPRALKQGRIISAPESQLVRKGLERIQKAINLQEQRFC